MFASLTKFFVFLREMQCGEDGNFQGIRRVRLRSDVAHAAVHFRCDLADFLIGERHFYKDGVFLIIDFNIDCAGLYFRQEFPQ